MLYSSLIEKTPIDKGWSGDKKYCVKTPDGKKYLLRITRPKKSDTCKKIFEMQSRLDIPMCIPLEIGECDEGIYTIFSWVDGKDANDVVPSLPESEQYAHGFSAGVALKKIHTIPAPPDVPTWEARYGAKLDRKIKAYTECALKYENGEKFIEYIKNNRHLIKNRPQCFQHGDYHIGNMMIENGTLVVIDFDRYDFGDPWEEFNRIVWSCKSAPAFSSGMVDGYFDNNVPSEFWSLLALYISCNTLSSLPWAIPFGEKEIITMKNQASDVLLWYDGMKNPIPTWYKEYK